MRRIKKNEDELLTAPAANTECVTRAQFMELLDIVDEYIVQASHPDVFRSARETAQRRIHALANKIGASR